jgi:hypothetical protein
MEAIGELNQYLLRLDRDLYCAHKFQASVRALPLRAGTFGQALLGPGCGPKRRPTPLENHNHVGSERELALPIISPI